MQEREGDGKGENLNVSIISVFRTQLQLKSIARNMKHNTADKK